MDKVDKKIKTYGIILGVILFVLLIAGFTYANLAWNSKSIVISGKSNCLEVESVKGNDITGGNLLLQDERIIISDGKITIKNGMIITNVTAKIKSTCSLDGYMTLNLNVTNLSSVFTSNGTSTGALKYVLASYDPSTYSTVSTTALNGKTFNIVNTGSITSTGTIKLREEYLSKTQTKAYLVIFYIDGDMANNDAASNSTNFKSNLEAIVTQNTISTVKTKTNAATFITNLYTNNEKLKTTNNNITYNYATSVSLMNDRFGSMSTNIDAGNIRYYGANPNNYIYFNCSDYKNQTSETCETWRIIGVFDGKVKIIRGSSLGEYSWDNKNADTGAETADGKNDWNTARLMKLLNPSNYYTIDSNDNGNGQSLYWNAQSGTCFSGQNNATTSCDFTSTGLKNDTTRNLIAETTYYTRGHDETDIFVDAMYDKERVSGTVVNATPPRTTSWTGKIAVAYPSDYGYAADLSLCQKQLSSYSDATCTANNWMKSISINITNTGYYSSSSWFLTPGSYSAGSAWFVSSSGCVYYYGSAYSAIGVEPVLSLNSELVIGSGTGTSSSPYQLSV